MTGFMKDKTSNFLSQLFGIDNTKKNSYNKSNNNGYNFIAHL